MPNIVEVYYSFQSPYCYICLEDIYDLESKYDVELLWQPFSAKAAGQQVPPTTVNPDKISYIFEDTKRMAESRGMDIGFPPGWPEEEFDPGRITRGAIIANDMGVGMEYNIKVFHRIWGLSEDCSQDVFFQQLCDELDVDLGEFLSKSAASDTRERAKNYYKRGKKAGVFDSPTLIFEGGRFFGPEKIADVAKILEAKGLKK